MEERNLNIVLATGLYPPEIGGPATYARMLEEKLPAHGYELTVVPFGQVRNRPKLLRHLAYVKLLWRQAKDADIVYALDPVSVGLPAWLVSFLRRKPFLLRVAGDYAWEQGQQRYGVTATLDEYTKERQAPLKVKLLAALQAFVAKRAVRIVVPSGYLKHIVTTWGVPTERIQVIYSALFPLTVTASKAELRQQLSFANFVITSVGRLVPWKGFVALINVVAALRQAEKDVSLVIAGDGPQAEELAAHVQERGLSDEVRLVGRLSKDALGATIKASDCFVLNTGYEGLSHQLLEVMDLSVPIVTTTVGGNPELVRDGVSGLMVPFNDEAALQAAIERLMDNDTLQQRLVQNARVRTRDFAQENVVEQLANFIRSEVMAR